MENVRRITAGIAFKTVSTILVGLFGLAVSVILNRHFGPQTYANLIMVYTITTLCMSLSHLGTLNTINKYIPAYLERKDITGTTGMLFSSTVMLSGGTLLFSFCLYVFSGPLAGYLFHSQGLVSMFKASVLFFIGLSFFAFITQIFQALQDWRKEAFLNIVYGVLYLTILAFFVFALKKGIVWALYSNAIGGILASALGICLLPSYIRKGLFNPDIFMQIKKDARIIFSFGMPLLLSGFLFYVIGWFDKIILARFRPAEELAFYYIAVIFYNIFMELLKVTATVMMPYLGQISQVSSDEMREKFTIVFKWFTHLIIFVSILLYFFIDPAIRLIYGEQYIQSIHAFRLLLILFIVRAFGNPQGMFLVNVFGKSRDALWLTAVTAAADVIFSIILIPAFGYTGAIWAGIIAYSLNCICSICFIKEIRLLIPYRIIWQATLALGGVVLLFFVISLYLRISNTYILSATLAFSYVLILGLLKGIDNQDILLGRYALSSLVNRKM